MQLAVGDGVTANNALSDETLIRHLVHSLLAGLLHLVDTQNLHLVQNTMYNTHEHLLREQTNTTQHTTHNTRTRTDEIERQHQSPPPRLKKGITCQINYHV